MSEGESVSQETAEVVIPNGGLRVEDVQRLYSVAGITDKDPKQAVDYVNAALKKRMEHEGVDSPSGMTAKNRVGMLGQTVRELQIRDLDVEVYGNWNDPLVIQGKRGVDVRVTHRDRAAQEPTKEILYQYQVSPESYKHLDASPITTLNALVRYYEGKQQSTAASETPTA